MIYRHQHVLAYSDVGFNARTRDGNSSLKSSRAFCFAFDVHGVAVRELHVGTVLTLALAICSCQSIGHA